MLFGLWDPPDIDAMGFEILPAVGAKFVGETAGVPRPPVAQVEERHRQRSAGVEPVTRLVDRPDVAGARVGVRDDELHRGLPPQIAQYHAQNPAFAIRRQVIRKPHTGEGQAVGRPGVVNQPVDIGRSDAQRENAGQALVSEHAEAQLGTACL